MDDGNEKHIRGGEKPEHHHPLVRKELFGDQIVRTPPGSFMKYAKRKDVEEEEN